ncbi:hypothetical protein PENTCL1PPCAC_3994, partial [Pristionchus entomophagus]
MASTRGVKLHEIGHPTYLFQLCLPNSREAISLPSACFELEKAADNMNELKFKQRCVNVHNQDVMQLHCDLCKKELFKFDIIKHFLSDSHRREVSSLGAEISIPVVKFWMGTLLSAAALAAPQL